jgi:hypothetical protein
MVKVECKSVDEMNDVSDDGDDDALFVEGGGGMCCYYFFGSKVRPYVVVVEKILEAL